MSEKRFQVINVRWQGKGEAVAFEDTQTNQVYFAENQEECKRIVELLNKQQALINALKKENKELKEDLEKGFDVPIPYVENSMRRLRAEHKVDEQQATISQLEEEKDYWKSKAMTLLMQVRRLTPRMTDKEVKEFNKELEDE